MTGYGDEGPKASKGAYDNTIQAASGTVAQCNGVKPGLSFVDYAAGYSAAFALPQHSCNAADWRGLLYKRLNARGSVEPNGPEAAAKQVTQTHQNVVRLVFRPTKPQKVL